MTIESVPIFTVDIGNTRAKFGIWLRELCSVGFNAADAATRPAYEFADVSAGFSEAARRISELHDELNPKARWIISSVNAKKTSALLEVIRELRPKDSVKLVTIDDIPTPIRYDFPEKLGVDRVVVAYAGIRRLGSGRPFLPDCASFSGSRSADSFLLHSWMFPRFRDNTPRGYMHLIPSGGICQPVFSLSFP